MAYIHLQSTADKTIYITDHSAGHTKYRL